MIKNNQLKPKALTGLFLRLPFFHEDYSSFSISTISTNKGISKMETPTGSPGCIHPRHCPSQTPPTSFNVFSNIKSSNQCSNATSPQQHRNYRNFLKEVVALRCGLLLILSQPQLTKSCATVAVVALTIFRRVSSLLMPGPHQERPIHAQMVLLFGPTEALLLVCLLMKV